VKASVLGMGQVKLVFGKREILRKLYDLEFLWQLNLMMKSSWAVSHIIKSLMMMMTEMVHETSVSYRHLTWLTSQEDFIGFQKIVSLWMKFIYEIEIHRVIIFGIH
jgi:hypothetical protein